VLKPEGVLVFKWSSVQFPLRDFLKSCSVSVPVVSG
jgi:hypothetical protein